MSSLVDSTPEEPQAHPIAFKISTQSQFLLLKMIGPSQSLFQSLALQSHPSLAHLLKDYLLMQQTPAKIKFCHDLKYPTSDHSVLQQNLTTLLQGYRLCIIAYRPQAQQQLQATKKYLLAMSDKVRIKTQTNSLSNCSQRMIIYFPIDLDGRVKKVIKHFRRYQRCTLVFPLNFFIKGQVKRQLHQRFLQQLALTYNKQIKKLPPKNQTILKHLTIHSINPHYISRDYRSSQWSKQEKGGIFGLSIDLAGLDYQIIKFYSLLQRFFCKMSYCVKTMENTPQEYVEEKYLRQKYDNDMIKYIPLGKQQIVIIGPPELFSKTQSEISKHFWTLSSKLFPNLKFALIKTKQNAFRRFLKVRKIQWEGMVISENSLTFYSDKHNYERIQELTQVFLLEHLKEQLELVFITSQEDLAVFQKFTLEALKISLFQDVEFFWQEGKAKCRCSQYLLKNLQQHLKELYHQHLEALQEFVTLDKIDDSLVIKQSNPPELVPERYLQWRLGATDLNFELVIMDERSCFKQDFAIVMVNNLNQCLELERLVGERSILQLKKSRDRFTELAVSDCRWFKSIVYWNIRSSSFQDYQYQQRRLYHQIISLVYPAKKDIKFVITKQLFTNSLSKLEFLIEKLAYREDDQYKKITLILSDQLRLAERQELISRLIYLFQQKLQEPITLQSQIPSQFFKEIIALKYFQLRWIYLDSQRKNQELICSPLNSFVFYSEKENIKFKGHKLGIILPKIHDTIEILANLHTKQAFYFIEEELVKVTEDNLLDLIQVVLSIVRHYFPQQSYIVLYSNKQKTNLICSIYVYSRKNSETLWKYRIDKSDHKIKGSSSESVTFKLQEKIMDRYRYTVHQKYLPQLRERCQKLM